MGKYQNITGRNSLQIADNHALADNPEEIAETIYLL